VSNEDDPRPGRGSDDDSDDHGSPGQGNDPDDAGGNDEPSEADELDDRRRRVLLYGGLTVLAGAGVASGWYATRDGDEPAAATTPTEEPTATATDRTPTDGVPALVDRFAPDLYFGRLEKWFPTDPRAFIDDADEPRPVEGFTALEEYSTAYERAGAPPEPTVFYRVTEAADGVDAVQYWMYSAFDQFTTNFHWHDWELLQVFVDRESGDPLLVSASAHSRKVPNNEWAQPDLGDGRRPGVLSEVGSHSSASEVNGVVPSFERLGSGGVTSDVTNDFLEYVSDVRVPFAYGLPRDEGARLPFVMPELEGTSLEEHPELSVDRSDFVDESVTVGSWNGLPTPPSELPLREPGLVFAHPDSPVDADVTYALEPIADLPAEISDFDGPQLSFDFIVPGFVEDRIASHITSVGIPWEQSRYDDPLADVTDPTHRQRIDGVTPSGLRNRVVGRVRQLTAGAGGALDRVADGAREALEDDVTVSLASPPTELAVQLASEDPEATVTRDGTFGFLHVEAGDHRLVVNGPGFAPLAERFVHDGGRYRAGSNGNLAVVANEDAAWIRGDGRETTGVRSVRVVEDYAGVVFDGQPAESDRFAVAVHPDGRYTVEVTDADGRRGSYRVAPDDFEDGEVVFDPVETGKQVLVVALREYLVDLRDLAARLRERDRQDDGDTPEQTEGDRQTTDEPAQRESLVLRELSSAIEAADGSLQEIEADRAEAANERLSSVVASLEAGLDALYTTDQDGFDDASVAALAPRLRTGIPRTDDAIATEIS
jgi:hypothetical protein